MIVNHLQNYREAMMTLVNRFLLFHFFFALIPASFADDNLRLVVRHDTVIDASWGGVNGFYQIPKGFVVVTSNVLKQRTVDGDVWRCVTVPALGNVVQLPTIGWLKQSDLLSFQEQNQKELAKLIADNESQNPDFTFPEIIKLQGKPEVRKAWIEIQKAFEENQKLVESKRLPEPYFARAEVWYSLGSYAEALSDYLSGLDYVKNQNDESAYMLYHQYFGSIRDTVTKSLTQPKSLIDLGPEEKQKTQYHYNKGYSNFWSGNYDRALQHFDNAVQIDWQNPYYWYYRGLTYRRLGNEQKALFNFVFGSHLEKLLGDEIRDEVSRQLTRLQGNERMFLEEIRSGDPSNSLIKKAFNR
jgi:tetratricopeptide (TPR) repeat protein